MSKGERRDMTFRGEMYFEYVSQRLMHRKPHAIRQCVNLAADAWKADGCPGSFSEYLVWDCSEILGLPDFETYLKTDYRIPAVMVNVNFGTHWYEYCEDLGYDPIKVGDIHHEHGHRSFENTGSTYVPGRY